MARREVLRAADQLTDWRWRLDNLYWITDKNGAESIFRLNWAQAALFEEMHTLSLILKARQLGISTFVLLFMLDACMFNSNVRCGIIDARLDDAKKKLDKIKFAYRRLPAWLRLACPLKRQNETQLEFKNGSAIEVGTSHRGGTLQYLHISEFGKICAKFPEKAREIRTGALNTIQAGQVVWIESTAEGQEGDFYELCDAAQAKQRMQAKLTDLDFKFHFFPWWQEPDYELDSAGIVVPADYTRYFDEDLPKQGIQLNSRKRAWYVKKAETQQGDMKREYPSTPKEAFEASLEGAIFGPQMEEAERAGRVGHFPAIPGVPVHTFWDIGYKDYTSIWFAQILFGPRIRLVGYYQNCLVGMPHYAEYCFGTAHAIKKFPDYASRLRTPGIFVQNQWKRGIDWFPHDGRVHEWGSGRSRIEQLIKVGFNAQLQRELGLHDGINAARAVLQHCEFDQAGTTEGVRGLKAYRWEWDDARGAWKTGTPRHDTASHNADAFRGLAVSYIEIPPTIVKPEPVPLRGAEAMTVAELLKLTNKANGMRM